MMMQMLENQPFDITSLHSAYANGVLPAEIIEEVFRRIEAANDTGIFLHLFELDSITTYLDALGPLDKNQKPLWGIPFAIKDNIDVEDAPTTAACPAFAYEAKKDAFVVEALRNAGAILIGKTNLDQFATGLVGVRSPFPYPKNAVDPDIVPGGSSSGSAVSVARGIVSFSLGTDTAGSGRVPAALNRIVGLKPTLGALSNTGVVPACRTLDTISIFGLTVEDAYSVYQVASAFDAEDDYARPIASPALSSPPPNFKVGVPNKATIEFFGDDIQASSFSEALEGIKELGGEIVEIDFTPFFQVAEMLYEGAWSAERLTVIEDLLINDAEQIHPVTRQIIGGAQKLSAADAFRGIYRLQALKRVTTPIIESVDLFCVPTIPTFYTCADLEADPVGPNSRFGTYTNFVNLLDMCGIAVPVKDREDGRPGSVTLLAACGRDAQIAALGANLHHKNNPEIGATGWSLPTQLELTEASDPNEIAIAVVGAHMSGLPLNHELTRLGGRFLKAAKTSDSYRLFSLPDGPPSRPGLIFDNDGQAIELEVWVIPESKMGAFVKGIPRPLGIGTVVLENGETVNGFICEFSGVTGAEDVTAFGSWRHYLNSLSSPSSDKIGA
jgi:allophanate hydrolase